jgi:hypothetical protein
MIIYCNPRWFRHFTLKNSICPFKKKTEHPKTKNVFLMMGQSPLWLMFFQMSKIPPHGGV